MISFSDFFFSLGKLYKNIKFNKNLAKKLQWLNILVWENTLAFFNSFSGEENSTVHGVLLDSGLLDGSIRIGATEYFVEPAKNYFSSLQHFHSVVYKLSDIHFPETNRTCMPSVEKSSDCEHSKYYSLSKRSVRDRKHAKEPNLFKHFVNKQHKTNIHKRKRLNNYSHKKKRHDGKRQKHHPNVNKVKKQATRDNNEIFDYFHDQSHHSTVGTFVDSRRKSKDWFIGSRSRLNPDYDSSANSKNSLNDIFGNITETFTLSSEWTSLVTMEESTLDEFTTANPETSLEDKNKIPEMFLEDKNDTSKTPSTDTYDASETPLKEVHEVLPEIFLEDEHDRSETHPINKYDKPKSFSENKYESSETFSVDMHDVPPEAKNDGPETSLEDKRDVPYWRELDALHYTEDGRTGSSEPYGVRSIQRTQWNEDRGQRHDTIINLSI